MTKHCSDNERIKHRYREYLRHAKRQSDPSIDKSLAAIDRFENYTRHKAFKKFHIEQATGFKRHLAQQRNPQTGKPLSAATMHSTLSALKAFFIWLADQTGFRSRISYSDAEYFNVSEKEKSVATAKREKPVPTLEQIRAVLASMPADTAIQKRDRALIAFTILTGARDGATASFKLKHVNLERNELHQDARQVSTKFSKTFTSWFFSVGDDFREIVSDWINFLRNELLWGDEDPLFPKTKVERGKSAAFEATGLMRAHWRNANAIRRVFRNAFSAVDLPYFNPHSFRNTLARFGQENCRTPMEFKSWSQNLGHEQVMTTLTSYGTVAPHRQAELIRKIGAEKPEKTDAFAEIQRIINNHDRP